MSDRHFPKALDFKSGRIDALKTRFITGVAITMEVGGDQFAIVGPDRDVAFRRAQTAGGPYIREEGAQNVVLMQADKFHELLKLAGIEVSA